MNELSISKQYPAEKYNLLGNTEVMVEVPDIKIGRASCRERV